MQPQTQDELFHEDWRDALRHLVKALGGHEAVGAKLWPSKTRKGAGNWLSDCLNDERPAKLDLDDIEALLRLGREAGCHTAMHILADRTSYDRPRPTTAKSERMLLIERQRRAMDDIARLQEELDRIDGAAELRRVTALSR